MSKNSTAFGMLNIDKPQGLTSHDIVARVRRKTGIRKVGHAGTLDPLATGVLIVCIGHATRLSEYVMHARKTYVARVHLGVETDSYDAEGEITARHDASSITRERVEAALPQFTGDIQQVPPMYSAIKKDGRKLYDLARAGQSLDLEARPVRIDQLEVLAFDGLEFTLKVECGAGTYIRSLAFDLGRVLGVGAHLSGLRRTASGTFEVENAVTLDTFMEAEAWQSFLLPPDAGLGDWPALHLTESQWADVVYGRALEPEAAQEVALEEGQLVRAYTPAGDLGAVLLSAGGVLRPHKVFST